MFEIPSILRPLGFKLLKCFSNNLLRSFHRAGQLKNEERALAPPVVRRRALRQHRGVLPSGWGAAHSGEALNGALRLLLESAFQRMEKVALLPFWMTAFL